MPSRAGRLIVGEISNLELTHASGREKKSQTSRMSRCVPPSKYETHSAMKPYASRKNVWPNQNISKRLRLRSQGSVRLPAASMGTSPTLGGNEAFAKIATRTADVSRRGIHATAA